MTIETEDVVALCQRLRLRFRHSAYLATDARLSTDPDCQEAADLIQSLSDRIDVLEGKVEIAAVILEEYGRLHRQKGTREGDLKAERNEQYAAEMRSALTKEAGIHGEGRNAS